jgi:hypothetical protein
MMTRKPAASKLVPRPESVEHKLASPCILLATSNRAGVDCSCQDDGTAVRSL